MAKTAVVNRKRRRRKNPAAAQSNPPKRRRRYYGAAQRRRNPSSPRKRRSSRRRRNPGSAFNYTPARRSNPDFFNLDRAMDIAPAAGLGVWAVRWGLKIAGPLETKSVTGKDGTTLTVPVPGLKHAIAGLIAAQAGSGMIGQFLGDARKSEYAEHAGLGFLADVFARTRLFDESEWVRDNLYLAGYDAPAELMSGLQESSALGTTQYYQDAAGNVYALEAGDEDLSGLQQSSTLGQVVQQAPTGARPVSSFGY